MKHYFSVRFAFIATLIALISTVYILPCQAGPPLDATAAANGTIRVDSSSTNWSLGTVSVVDDGGNYNAGGVSDPYVQCIVYYQGSPKSREGTITYTQNIVPANSSPGNLTLNLTAGTGAIFKHTGQTAHAKVYTPVGGGQAIWAEATATTVDVEAIDLYSGNQVTYGATTTQQFVMIVEADVSTP